MTAPEADDLAVGLTRQVVAVPGVRGVYPKSVVAAIVNGIVRSSRSPATGLLQVRLSDELVLISARLATDHTVPAVTLIAAVADTLSSALPGGNLDLHIEIVNID